MLFLFSCCSPNTWTWASVVSAWVYLSTKSLSSESFQGRQSICIPLSFSLLEQMISCAIWFYLQFSSVTHLCPTLCDPMDCSTPGLPVYHQLLEFTRNSCPLSQWWCHLTMSSSVVPFSSCPQSFPASGSFPMSPFFTSSGQRIEVSTSTSVLAMNTQYWFPLGWTGWISLYSKGLSRVFSNTTVQKHQFFSTWLSL